MAGITSIVRYQMYTGNANQSIYINDADGIIVTSYCSVPLNGVSIGGGALSRKWASGDASVWFRELPITSGYANLVVTASSSIVYSVATVKNGADISFSASGYSYTPNGGSRIDLTIPTAYTSPGNLCLGSVVSVPWYTEGTYLSEPDSWTMAYGGSMGADGRIRRVPYYKSSGGGAEAWNIGLAYGGFYSITTVIKGYDLSNFDTTIML